MVTDNDIKRLGWQSLTIYVRVCVCMRTLEMCAFGGTLRRQYRNQSLAIRTTTDFDHGMRDIMNTYRRSHFYLIG